MRLRNLTDLVIGRHLVFDGAWDLLKLAAAETKSGRPYPTVVPAELNPAIDLWLEVHRQICS